MGRKLRSGKDADVGIQDSGWRNQLQIKIYRRRRRDIEGNNNAVLLS